MRTRSGLSKKGCNLANTGGGGSSSFSLLGHVKGYTLKRELRLSTFLDSPGYFLKTYPKIKLCSITSYTR